VRLDTRGEAVLLPSCCVNAYGKINFAWEKSEEGSVLSPPLMRKVLTALATGRKCYLREGGFFLRPGMTRVSFEVQRPN